ncbi:MAG: PaaI family thioesterase [Solirubrobacteraceae bacterium]
MNLDANPNSFIGSIPILEKMGITIESFTESSVTTKVPFEGNTNHIGTIYAGVIFSLAEFTGVPLMFPKMANEGVIFIIRDMSIRYRRPATTDLFVTANFTDEDAAFCKAEIAKNGKVDFLIEMEIKDTTGEVVALTKNNYHLIKM